MDFPVQFHLFGRAIPAHAAFELAAYVVGFQTYLLLRRRDKANPVPIEQNLWLIVACVVGAFFGSKFLAWLESAQQYWAHRDQLAAWLGGKTIVGGILGGWIGVEVAKRFMGITVRTGDLFVFPLVLGIAIGRVGCFLTGLPDHTHGVATSFPWGVDFGDGIKRHPSQLYEIAFVLALGVSLLACQPTRRSGDLFRWFIIGYLGFRFAVEFIKPRDTIPLIHLSAIQVASLVGAAVAFATITRHDRVHKEAAAGATVDA